MKVIEMLSKGMKAIPISKKEEWKDNKYLYIEENTIVLKNNTNSDADFYYDIIDVKWLMDEGIEFVEKHKKYFISYKGKLYGIKQESVNSVLIIREVTCGDLECNSIHFPCMDCPFNKGRKIEIDDIHAKLHTIEY